MGGEKGFSFFYFCVFPCFNVPTLSQERLLIRSLFESVMQGAGEKIIRM